MRRTSPRFGYGTRYRLALHSSGCQGARKSNTFFFSAAPSFSLACSSERLGNLDYGEPIGKEFRGRIEAKFFAHYLKDGRDSISKTRPASRPGRIRGSIIRTFRPRNRGQQPLSSRARPAELERVDDRSAHQRTSAIPPIRFLTGIGPSSPRTARLAVVQLADRRSALCHRTARMWPCGSCRC